MKTNNNTLQEKALKLKKQRRNRIIASLLGIAILVWGVIEVAFLFLDYKQTGTSNDAQIEQYISPVNLRASGYIKKIYFTEHQSVKKGDTLLVLDDREYRIRVMEAEAALKDAMAGATVIDATLQTTQNSASVYEASIAEIEIRLAKLEKDRQRYENLLKRNAATPIQLEQMKRNMRLHERNWRLQSASKKLPCRALRKFPIAEKVRKLPYNVLRLHSKWHDLTFRILLCWLLVTGNWDVVHWKRDNISVPDKALRISFLIRRSG